MHQIVDISILFSCVILGGLLLVWFRNRLDSSLKLFLAFSGAFLLGLCFTHLVPESYNSDLKHPGLFVIGGFLLQIILEFFSRGIEHGHAHLHADHDNRFPVVIMLSLSVHSFVEGMPFGAEEHNHSLLLGIVLHKMPVAIVLMGMFLKSGLSRTRAFIWLLVFAIMSPLGVLVSTMLHASQLEMLANITPAIMAVLIGMLLHVSTTILFESSDGHKFNMMKFISMLIGFTLAFIA